MKGSTDQKISLFNYFIEKAKTEGLEAWEAGMLEAVKKMLYPEKKTVQMASTIKGQAGLNG